MVFSGVRRAVARVVYPILKNYVKPRSKDELELKREFFAKLYLLTAFTFFGYVTIRTLVYESRQEKSLEKTIENLGLKKNIRVIKIQGLTKVEDYVIDANELNREKKGITEKELE